MANKNKGTYEREEENQKRVEIQVQQFKKGIVKSVKCGTQAKRRTKREFILFVRDWWRRSRRRCEEVR